MKIVEGYVLRRLIDEWVVVPIGKGQNLFGQPDMTFLTESSAMLWKKLEQGADESTLINILCEHYEIDKETAATDVIGFLAVLKDKHLLIED